jgi:hypothetical protein
MLKQQERSDGDGGVTAGFESVANEKGRSFVRVTVEQNGKTEIIVCSQHNAFRLFVVLAVLFEIPLSSAVKKGIKL